MAGEGLRRILRELLLEDDCVWKLVVLKAGDRLKNDEEFKDCYECIGHKEGRLGASSL
ncbi:MAG: hypothetical protein N3G19_00050 [Candidatus Pacearchaeota archaeon]|nr:hypothetical protein [Candidatus Pacearchaeota archaeon]